MNGRRNVLTSSLIFLGSVLVLTVVMSSTAWAKKKDKEESPDDTVAASETPGLSLQMVRRLDNQDVLTTFDRVPGLDEGVAFPPGANIVVKLNPPARAEQAADAVDVGLLRRGQSDKAETSATIEMPDPINMAFDVEKKGNAFRMFTYDATTKKMTAIKYRQDVPAPDTIAYFDMAAANLEDVQGMALDAQRNRLYLLNVRKDGGAEFLDINIGGARTLPPSRLRNAKRQDLSAVVGEYGKPRCIAYNPQNRGLYLLNPDTEEIIALTTNGTLVARGEVVDLDFTDLKGCIFAPSSDGTDNPSLFNLFIATGGSPSGEVTEWLLN